MKRPGIVLAAVAAVAFAFVCQAPPALAKKSRPADREKAVRLAHELAEEPLRKDAPEKRKWLMRWLKHASDVTVNVRDLLGPLPSDSYPYSKPIVSQMVFSNAAFVIEHPDRAGDEVAAQTAGVAGALNAYQAILRAHPDARLAFFDALVRKRDAGKLENYVRESVVEQSER